MKKALLMLLILNSFLICKSQQIKISDLKRKFLVGGIIEFDKKNFNIESISGTQEKIIRSNFTIGPKVGYFIFKGFALGTDIVFSRDKLTQEGEEPYINNGIQVNPFIRYYTPIKVFAEAQIGYNMDLTSNSTISSFYQFGLGYPIFINENISIDIIGKYYNRKLQYGALNTKHIKGILGTISFQIYL